MNRKNQKHVKKLQKKILGGLMGPIHPVWALAAIHPRWEIGFRISRNLANQAWACRSRSLLWSLDLDSIFPKAHSSSEGVRKYGAIFLNKKHYLRQRSQPFRASENMESFFPIKNCGNLVCRSRLPKFIIDFDVRCSVLSANQNYLPACLRLAGPSSTISICYFY